MSTAEVLDATLAPATGAPSDDAATIDRAARTAASAAGVRSRGLGSRYWALWLAGAVSSCGDGLALVAFPLLALRSTDDPRLIAGVAAAQRVPWLLALLTGALADRFDRRRFFAVVEAGRSAVLVALALVVATGRHDLLALYLAALALGTFETAFSAASMATLPSIVHLDDLPRANGYLYSVQMAGEQFAGPALGGLLFTASATLPFLLDGGSFVLSGLLLLHAVPARQGGAEATAPSALWRSCVEGWQWFRTSAATTSLAAVVAGFAFCQAMVLSLLVLLCANVLHLSPSGYGVFLAVGATGNILGAAAAGRVTGRRGTAQVLRVAGLAAAVAYGIVALAPHPAIAAGAFVIEAVAVAVGNVASVSLRQRLIPSELLGRVGNIFRTCIFGAMPLGALSAGVLAAMTSVRTAMLLAAVLQAVAVLFLLRRRGGLGAVEG